MPNSNKQAASHIHSFNFIAANDAKILILGSMPGEASLQQQQYYAHPRNAFWPIIEQLFVPEPEQKSLNYQKRLQVLLQHKIALWDVLAECQRSGSLDSNIQGDSVILNNFAALFEHAPQIKALFFNGKTAEKLFKRHFLRQNPQISSDFQLISLPSTSPAHASMNFSAKLAQWEIIKNLLK